MRLETNTRLEGASEFEFAFHPSHALHSWTV